MIFKLPLKVLPRIVVLVAEILTVEWKMLLLPIPTAVVGLPILTASLKMLLPSIAKLKMLEVVTVELKVLLTIDTYCPERVTGPLKVPLTIFPPLNRFNL